MDKAGKQAPWTRLFFFLAGVEDSSAASFPPTFDLLQAVLLLCPRVCSVDAVSATAPSIGFGSVWETTGFSLFFSPSVARPSISFCGL